MKSVLLALICAIHGVLGGPGTTQHLEEIFIGRCWDYQLLINPQAFVNGTKNCTALWEKFTSAFKFKDSCNVQVADYDDFTTSALHNIPPNMAMFWGRVYQLVMPYTAQGKRGYTLSDTLLAYVVTDTAFCGKVTAPGFDYDHCPDWGSCAHAADYSFYARTSKEFSLAVQGEVYIMLNSTFTDAYNNQSIFAEYELPNLRAPRITKANIYLVKELGETSSDYCGKVGGSIANLRYILELQGVPSVCIDDPRDITYFMCTDNPNHARCRAIRT